MNDPSEWRPSAGLAQLKLRAKLVAEVRRFFDSRGYWEVDTPSVSHERGVDAHLETFLVTGEPIDASEPADRADREKHWYLQASPEFAMKRLLVAGAEAIYQISHVFRFGERGRLHNQEFTMIEWYRVGDTHHDQMQIVEQLVIAVCTVANAQLEESNARDRSADVRYAISEPFLRTTYREAFLRHAGIDVALMETALIRTWAGDRGLHPPPGLTEDDRDGWLNWLLAELVEPHLGKDRPEFLFDYPESQAALARIRPDSPPVAERFELYCRGIELCNGYHELGDTDEIIRRIEVESARRENEGQTPLPAPRRFLASMRAGLPDCCGVALGFDRLMIVATGAESIDEVIPFPFEWA